MAIEMAARPLYRARHATRRCPDCRRTIPPAARYCDRDRERRRALTFLLAAREHTEAFGDEAINGELEVLIGRLGTAK